MENASAEKTVRRVAKNTLAQVARFAAIAVSKFLIVVVIARWAGVEQVGEFTFVMTMTLAFGFINHLGLTLLLIREIAQQQERVHEYLGNALTLSLGLGTFYVFIMGGIAAWLGYSDQIVVAVYLVAVAMVMDTLINLFNSAFSGYERMELGAVAIIVQELAFLIIGAFVLYLNLPFLWLFVIFILSRLVGLIASVRIYWGVWGQSPRPRFDWITIKELLYKTRPFILNAALSPIFVRIDVLLLSYFQGNTAVGFYEVASTLFYRFNVLARMFNLAMLPLVARQYATLGRAVVRYVKSAVKYQAVLAMPITMLCWILGGKIIIFIYGPEFAPAVLAFQIMASITFLRFLDNTLGLTLTAIDLQWQRSLTLALMAIFNIAINLYVLPRYSYVGAAITSVLTEIGYFILLFGFLLTRLPNPIELNMLVKPVLAAVVMALPLLLLHNWSILILLPLGAIVYGGAILILRVFTPQEIELLLKAGRIQNRVPAGLQRWLAPPTTVTPK